MKIIILGAGHTGASVARSLANEGNDVVVIDINAEHLRELQDKVDIATICGVGTYPDSLQRANMQEADLLIAVMQRDEDNITACHIAWSLYRPPLIIARIRNAHYLNHPELFTKDSIPVDALISPESLVTQYLRRLIEYPGVHQLHDFANASLKLVALEIHTHAKAVDLDRETLQRLHPAIKWLGLFHEHTVITAAQHARLTPGDKLLYLVLAPELANSVDLFLAENKPYKRIILAGGGHVGKRLARALQDTFKVKVVEKNPQRANQIAEDLEKTMVLCGDATDRDLLVEEGIRDSDVFCALTSSDEANILSSMLAKKLGVRNTLCLVNKPAYVDMIPKSAMDTVFSPEKITSATILRYVRKGGIIDVCPLHGSTLEVLEIIVEGNQETSRVVGLPTEQLDLPDEVSLCALVRGDEVLNLTTNPTIQTRDHLILVVPAKQISAIEKYFRVLV